jgi:SAM-dependent methyltransferase
MCSSCVPTVDADASQQFGERLVGVLNQAGLAFMLSIGHRTGLFDVMAALDSVTSREIAERAGLNERYVREWLGGLVTAGVVHYVPEEKTYRLPAEHAAFLTQAATPNNVAANMQFFSVLGRVEDAIVDCFHNGGGVHYSEYTRFHDVMAEESAQTVVAALDEHILKLIPGLTERLATGIDVLDVGCGAGRALLRMAELFPASRFTGYDFSEEAVQKARDAAAELVLTNVRFEVRDVSSLEEVEAFDLITAFDAIHDQRDPAAVLAQIHKALRSSGTYLMQDIATSSHLENNLDHPVGTFLYTISTMHCMTVSLALGGAGLGTCWGEELALQMLNEAGFQRVEVRRLDHDMFNNYFVIHKD